MMVQKSNSSERIKSIFNVAKLTIYLIFTYHIIGCFFWATITVSKDLHDADGRSL